MISPEKVANDGCHNLSLEEHFRVNLPVYKSTGAYCTRLSGSFVDGRVPVLTDEDEGFRRCSGNPPADRLKLGHEG
ncbi:hypothetical protein MLD38_008293 [Melastoma candidum]|uniref:Uncharacterized protein n=1 Tax=Melastoma candidum TaxID=119954 RepID=A0ACB9RU18_9MYRT|nr:hypothetical protein MLD38_008293 [Melastoma candidum]